MNYYKKTKKIMVDFLIAVLSFVLLSALSISLLNLKLSFFLLSFIVIFLILYSIFIMASPPQLKMGPIPIFIGLLCGFLFFMLNKFNAKIENQIIFAIIFALIVVFILLVFDIYNKLSILKRATTTQDPTHPIKAQTPSFFLQIQELILPKKTFFLIFFLTIASIIIISSFFTYMSDYRIHTTMDTHQMFFPGFECRYNIEIEPNFVSLSNILNEPKLHIDKIQYIDTELGSNKTFKIKIDKNIKDGDYFLNLTPYCTFFNKNIFKNYTSLKVTVKRNQPPIVKSFNPLSGCIYYCFYDYENDSIEYNVGFSEDGHNWKFEKNWKILPPNKLCTEIWAEPLSFVKVRLKDNYSDPINCDWKSIQVPERDYSVSNFEPEGKEVEDSKSKIDKNQEQMAAESQGKTDQNQEQIAAESQGKTDQNQEQIAAESQGKTDQNQEQMAAESQGETDQNQECDRFAEQRKKSNTIKASTIHPAIMPGKL